MTLLVNSVRVTFSHSYIKKNRAEGLELVSKELNHLEAILHVYVGDLIFMKWKKILSFFKKKREILLIIFVVKSLQKEQNRTNLLVWKVRQIQNDFFKPTFLPKNLFSCVCWKKMKTPKRHFEINWPLWLPICRNNPAITPKWINSKETNFKRDSIKYIELWNS